MPDWRLFSTTPAARELALAQIEAFSKQVPVLYVILGSNAVALAWTHWTVAPFGLVFTVPGVLIALCLARIVVWKRRAGRAMTAGAAQRRLLTASVIGPVLGVIYLVWALSLYDYGSPTLQAHVIFFVGITVVSCIFCLMHVRAAALGVTGAIITPFLIFLLTTGDAALIAIGINLALVSVAMVYMLLVYSRDFAVMVAAQAETQRLSDENRLLANVDSLTGLPNRRQFFSRLNACLDTADGPAPPFVLGMVDLDGFKPINDLYGHFIGDQVLAEMGLRLRELASPNIFIARLGGDEFGVIILDVDRSQAQAFGDRVCATLQEPLAAPSVLAKVSASVGLVESVSCLKAEMLYERADYALYHAKQHQRGRAVMLSAELALEIRRQHAIEQGLLIGDLEAELSLLFQPIFDVDTMRVTAFEALARWSSAELGPVSPGEFIPLAERSSLINRVTQILLRRALAEARGWPDAVKLSFNLSARDLSPAAILGIVSIVEKSGVPSRRIIFEVTETAAMRDIALAEESLALLRRLGARIALDDFGSGHSSLTHVRRLPLDKIKIDRDFIVDIEADGASRAIVKSVIDLCRNLELCCIVEGVETERQKAILSGLGCNVMQGYLFGRPISAAAVPSALARTMQEAS
ncbi:putative bifunctional diguanylate cyclase/phosphodiesterase [Hansschlegelia plantiphila]|nr:EAL domain-containing protein [Hansschlegelia plantiphila]